MPPKKRVKGSTSMQYDTAKFVSQAAFNRYQSSLEKKTPIAERGLNTCERVIRDQILARRWANFVKQPGSSLTAVVREFYANAPERDNGKVFVRGIWVKLDRAAINQYFGLSNIDNDEYQAYLENVDHNEIINRLCTPGTSWKMGRNGEYISFPPSALRNRAYKAWHNFICARFMPVSHVSDVLKERAVLLYAIVTGKSIDVGRVISRQIGLSVLHAHLGLYFPSLITEVCSKAGVHWDATEEWVGPRHVINDSVLASYRELEAQEPTAGPSSSGTLRPPRPPRSPGKASVHERLDRMDRRLDHMDDNICNLAQMINQLARHMNMNMDNFPTVTAFNEEDEATEDEED